MDFPQIIIAVVTVAAVAGAATIGFKRAGNAESIRLLQINVGSFKDAAKLSDQRIAYLEGQLVIKDETIKRLLGDPQSHKSRRRRED